MSKRSPTTNVETLISRIREGAANRRTGQTPGASGGAGITVERVLLAQAEFSHSVSNALGHIARHLYYVHEHFGALEQSLEGEREDRVRGDERVEAELSRVGITLDRLAERIERVVTGLDALEQKVNDELDVLRRDLRALTGGVTTAPHGRRQAVARGSKRRKYAKS